MNTDQLRDAFEAIVAADPDVVERDELAGLVASASRVRAMLDGFDVRCARRTRELANHGRSEPPGSMFNAAGNRSSKQSKKISERSDTCDAMPGFEDALNGGEVSSGHLDALGAARNGLDDAQRAEFDDHHEELLAAAEGESVDAFARRCRELARRIVANSCTGSDADELDAQRTASKIKHWVDRITGMGHTHLELDPVRDAKLWGIIDAYTARFRNADGNAGTPWSQLQVNAFVEAVAGDGCFDDGFGGDAAGESADAAADVAGGGATRPARGGGGEQLPRVPEMLVLVDLQTLISGLHSHGICETQDGVGLPVSTVRRLCCEAEIVPVVLGGHGEVLDVGRSERTANRAQRRALRAMHRTCAHPDCTVGFSACRIHHVRWWWEHRGLTDIDNLVPLCERHHHLVHEGRWTLTMTPDRVATWTRPDGVVYWTGSSIDRVPVGGPPPRTAETAA